MNRSAVSFSSRAGFTLKGILVVAALIALAAWALLPKYFAQLEKTQALSMQAMLVNTAIAQFLYHSKTQTYADNWADLMPYVNLPASLQVSTDAVPGQPAEYFFGFGPRGEKKQDGYNVTLRVQPDGKGGVISAARTGSAHYQYDLLRAFPQGQTECVAGRRADAAFCKVFLQMTQDLELKSLTPAEPAAQTPGESAHK